MSKVLSILLSVFGTILIGLSGFSAWALNSMLNDQVDHYAGLMFKSLDEMSTLPVGPQPWWLGDGYLGIYAPTVFAIIGTICIVYAWRVLSGTPTADNDNTLA